MVEYLILSCITVLAYMSIVFIAAMLRRDNSVVDTAWGIGFILIAFLTLFLKVGANFRQVLVTALIFLWGGRLSVHIGGRNKGKKEDFRYAQWRKDWGKWFVPRSYLQIFLLQGIIMIVVSYPVILVNSRGGSKFAILDIAGILLWCIGFYFEAEGDHQLRKFKKNPENRGKIMTSGLWKYTRHPNYFGEAVMWWGIYIIALSVKQGWTAVVSPVLITFLLLKVSGVAMLEKKYAGNKEFAEYAQRTNAFFPWFPKTR
ncbi:MAG: DUF1295 domain-containing protein [Candidatus Aminicenantes bacterium]|nr:DUF1295 domain-containing protein [Candidatus Aminicenantes bacterium]